MNVRSAGVRRCVVAGLMMGAVAGCSQSRQALRPQELSSGWMLTDAATVKDGGAAISRPGYLAADWKKAVVPGTVLTSLVADGVYPEPLYGENNRPDRIPESLSRATYWYRTEFTAPAAATSNDRHVWLNFEGINYIAEVWVNGHDVGPVRVDLVTPCESQGPGWSGGLVADFQH